MSLFFKNISGLKSCKIRSEAADFRVPGWFFLSTKRLLFFFISFLLVNSAFAQRTVEMKNLWSRPQVHVLFQGYTISFTIKDINKALKLLEEMGDSTYGLSSKLDTAKDYYIELFPSLNTQYRSSLQPLIQMGVGAFLLTAGHAVVENPRHKIRKEIIEFIDLGPNDEHNVLVTFYDSKSSRTIFFGRMKDYMYNKDLGID
jgi:hypothetical protein